MMIGMQGHARQLLQRQDKRHRHLPGHPVRLVQFLVSAGLLTDGSSHDPAFPGFYTQWFSGHARRLQLRGQFRFTGDQPATNSLFVAFANRHYVMM